MEKTCITPLHLLDFYVSIPVANICICPHLSRQRKCNANLQLKIYQLFAPFANIGKSVFSSSVKAEEGPDLLTDIKVIYRFSQG